MRRVCVIVGAVVAAVAAPAARAALPSFERVSSTPAGSAGNAETQAVAISGSGRWVAFDSAASDLVPGDTNDVDVFLRDRLRGTTTLVSTTTEGHEASFLPAISADGRWVAFTSGAASLDPGNTIGVEEVFVRDRVTGAISRASVGPGGAPANASSGDIQPAGISLSADGRYVAFPSAATNLAPGDDNGLVDVFVRDRRAGTTLRVPAESTGEPLVAADGSRLVGIGAPHLSADGRTLAFVSVRARGMLLNVTGDVYVRDLRTGATRRVTQGADAGGADESGIALSGNGRRVAYSRLADGSVVVVNLCTGGIRRIMPASVPEPGAGRLQEPSLDFAGRRVAFSVYVQAGVGLRGPVDVWVRDLRRGTTTRASRNPIADPGGQGYTYFPALSANGRFVDFLSTDPQGLPGDANGVADAFVARVRR